MTKEEQLILLRGASRGASDASEAAVESIRGYDQEILARQRQYEEDQDRQKELEYQRRQTEALEKQNQKTYRTIYDY